MSKTAGELHDLRVKLAGLRDRYVANGGQAFVHQHFVDADGQARTDLDLTEANIITSVSALNNIIACLETYKDPLIQAAP